MSKTNKNANGNKVGKQNGKQTRHVRAAADTRRTANLAYPIVEAANRVGYGLDVAKEWNGKFLLEGRKMTFPKTLNIEEIRFLFVCEWDKGIEMFVMDALMRSAYALGYVWDNEADDFVKEAA